MYNDHYQEHVDHEMGRMSEFEMCHAEARMAMPLSDATPEDARFHVFADIVHLCRATDATVGSYVKLQSSHDTVEEAQDAVKELAGPYDDMVHYIVRPGTKVPKPEIKIVINDDDDDDCPF